MSVRTAVTVRCIHIWLAKLLWSAWAMEQARWMDRRDFQYLMNEKKWWMCSALVLNGPQEKQKSRAKPEMSFSSDDMYETSVRRWEPLLVMRDSAMKEWRKYIYVKLSYSHSALFVRDFVDLVTTRLTSHIVSSAHLHTHCVSEPVNPYHSTLFNVHESVCVVNCLLISMER